MAHILIDRLEALGLFKIEEYPIYFERCPLCNSEFAEFQDSDRDTPWNSERGIFRVCMARKPRKSLLASFQAKSHYFESLGDSVGKSYLPGSPIRRYLTQNLYIRQIETHPSKYLLNITYKGTGSPEKFNTKDTTVQNKDTSNIIQIKGWWKPGDLKDDYRVIYERAKRLLHFS